MIRSPRRLLLPILCTALLAGGMLAQLAVSAEPAFAAASVTSMTITSSDSSSVYGQSVTLHSNLTGGSGTPTGTIDITEGASPVCSGTLAEFFSGLAVMQCNVSNLSVGTHQITATYSGDGTYDPEVSTTFQPALSQDVAPAGTTTQLDADNPAIFSAPSTLTATVTPTSPGAGAVTGSVDFQAGGTDIVGCETQPITNGVAGCSTPAASGTGSRNLTATYSGDVNFTTSTTSATQNLVKAAADIVVTSSDPHPNVGASIDYTATLTPVAPATATPDGGSVAFLADAASIDGCSSVSMSAGVATCTTTAGPRGTVSITAVHSATADWSSSTSAALVQDVGNLGSTTAVTSSDLTTEFNHSVTFTATVTPFTSGGPTPTGGTVSFSDGASPLTGCETQPITAGVATCATSALAVADHTITADYSGDDAYTPSTSSSITQTVTKAGTALVVTTDTDPSVYSQPIELTATLTSADGAPDGTIGFIIDGNPIVGCSARPMTAGVATCDTSELSASPGHQVGAHFTATADYLASDAGVFMDTDNADTTTAVTSSNDTSSWAGSVTFTATITPVTPATLAPTRGHVAFTVNGDGITGCAAVAITTGTATCTTSTTPVGTNAIAAEFVPADSYNGSTAPDLTQTVTAATTTTLGSSSNPSMFSESIVFTATVATNPAGGETPTGAVEFKAGSTDISGCEVRLLVGGTVTCTVPAFAVGGHSVTGVYLQTDGYTTSTSNAITQTVGTASTTTAIASSDSTTSWNETVTYTATIAATSPATATPDGGTVAFRRDGATIIGCLTQPLVSGTASCVTTSDPVGSFAVTASFSGNTSYASSDSPPILQTVSKAATATALVSDHNPSRSGQPVTLTANVTSTAGVPDGTVSFFQVQKDSSQRLVGSGTLASGVASMTTDAMTVRIGSIIASYDGNSTFQVSAVTVPQTVSRSYSTTLMSSSQKRSVAGRAVTFTATVASAGAGSGTPSGLVALYRVRTNGSRQWIGRGTLRSTGVTLISVSDLPIGAWKIVAEYRGSTEHRSSHRSMTQTVGA